MADPSRNNRLPSHQRQQQPLHLHVQHVSRPNEDVDIERLLSSTFYPGAASNYNHSGPSPSNSAGTGTVFLEDDDADSFEQNDDDAESPDSNNKTTRNKGKATPGQGKAAGAKRKPGDNEGPGERRRKQIREAQRAYRQRKISQTAYLEERVKQLESAIENMSTVVLSFSEELIGSNILSCQSELTSRLRDALSTCLTLVRETGGNAEPESAGASSMALVPTAPPSIPHSVPNKPTGIKNIFGNKPYPDMNTSMTVAAFMDMLATSAVYYGYLALADPTLSTTRLHRHFGLPLQLMSRDKLLSFFSALFQSRLCRSNESNAIQSKPGMPFFSIGGAGTHYSPALLTSAAGVGVSGGSGVDGGGGGSSGASVPLSLPWANTANQCSTWTVRNNAWTVPMDPSNVPANLQERFEGDWFDMQDLELYLLERGVSLRMKPNKESHGDVNVPLFLRGLMLNSTCLGQSPGFRRQDVEVALNAAQVGPQA
ncbi:vesicular-fusion protein SEC18 [Cordyceps fumosorosea ARSEF 2679]|uniref:Vesicular-fusion protein SEC18 n=1 Tax=Cordyceps fumosorosea (strain ARSEF 2679) TaxID=1081104 RepID=A0A167W196_CORFA|nr:vesicular-fusion protein SEC18 [Cordyceps fumosorosea ARSEF 2679]OAA63209.1 vesicular-fusion protein SEC18 [Cordyceps fumosorosea ARSEF 2679]